MKASFPAALEAVLKSEGGYVNDPRDSGGATNKGITQKTYDVWCDDNGRLKQPIRAITNDEVAAIYKNRYWDEVHGDDLPAGIDYLLFDYAVHSGPLRALKAYVSCKTIDDICDQRLDYLQTLRAWPVYANGWTNRIADVRATANKLVAAASPTSQTPTKATPAPTAPFTIQPPKPATQPPAAPESGFLAWVENLFAFMPARNRQNPQLIGDLNMLNGQKTNIASVTTLGLLGGVGMSGGWQAVINLAPGLIAVLLPIIAMTLRNAIKNHGLQVEAKTVEQILAAARNIGWGPVSQVAGAADDVLVKALASDASTDVAKAA